MLNYNRKEPSSGNVKKYLYVLTTFLDLNYNEGRTKRSINYVFLDNKLSGFLKCDNDGR